MGKIQKQAAIIALHKDGSILRIIRDEHEVESTKMMLSQRGYQLFVVHKTTELSTNSRYLLPA